jgi:hypothetical protein
VRLPTLSPQGDAARPPGEDERVTKSLTPYDPKADRFRVQRYRLLLAAQTDRDIREMLQQLINETELRLAAFGSLA